MKIEAVNENTVIVYFGDQVCPEVADQVALAAKVVTREMAALIIDLVPSCTSMLVVFNSSRLGLGEFQLRLQQLLEQTASVQDVSQANQIELPVYYGREVALDADEICEYTGLDFEQVVRLHSEREYRVYAIGFAPGFAYLGRISKRIEIPRKSTARLKVPAGSLAIADRQTAIYPATSPGGWHVIGRTPDNLIDFERENFTVFEIGARVKFQPVSREMFLKMGGSLEVSH